MRLFAIRHTSVAVKSGICYGQTDVPVAITFEAESEKIKNQIKDLQIENIYSSPLTRCKVLAESLFEIEKIVFDVRLKELNFGNWELKTWDEIYSQPQGKVWMDNYQTLPTLNGESYPEMVARISAFLNEIKDGKKENVAIVAHAGVIRILKSLIENKPIAELFQSFKPAYGSVSEFEI